MSRTAMRLALVAALLSIVPGSVAAQRRGGQSQQRPADLSDSALVSALEARSIGPAVMSGRVVDIAVAPAPEDDPAELGTVFYIAAASGGVWKTTNGGMSWAPVFDDQDVLSIGAVAVDPNDADVVWVGTGENNNQRSSSFGDGVYKSVDGGKTFVKMGLERSQQVGRIRVSPEDPDVVWVAAAGPLWAAGGERGVYKTTDGGATWRNTLQVDEHTGAVDLVLDPTDPDVMYAATQQRERRAYSYVSGGPGSGIWKSMDGGESWTRLTRGLPTSDMGRIGVDVSQSDPDVVYAVIEGSEHGVYRSTDGGSTWEKRSDVQSIPWYFGQIRVDPRDPDTVYHLGVSLQVSHDGGATWERTGRGPHADQHAMWINPENPDHMILGNDGGLYVSRDRGDTWDFSPNLPISQFYAVSLDQAQPFYGLAGGLQDNSTWGGPSRTRARGGIFNADWYGMAGGDGFYAAIDPTDPDIAYVESQNGNILRYDRRTGDRKPIQPQPPEGEPDYRFNWSAPIKISPWDHNTIYFAANYLFKSTDRGDSWTRLGGDLTRNIDADSLPMMGAVPKKDAVARGEGTAPFSNISDIDISSVQRGLLITGTDDGQVSISTDDGQTWTKQTRFPGVPDTAYVSKVRLSTHDASVMYVTFDNHRSNDFTPYVIKSTDGGKSWTNIGRGIHALGGARSFAEHPDNPNLLFVGTETGLFVTLDGGGSWSRISAIPHVRVDDLAIQKRDDALVVATHGRGFYILDDLLPLQHLAEAKTADGPFLFPVKSELEFTPDPSPSSGTHGARDYAGDNPPVGTRVAYLLKSGARSAKLEVVATTGDVVRSLDAPASAGLHQVLWDFRADAPYSGPPRPQQNRGGFGGFFGFGGNGGPLVVPGQYTVRLTVDGATHEQPVTVRKDPALRLSDAQLADLYQVRTRQLALNAKLTMAIRQTDDIREQLTQAKAAMKDVDVPASLTQMADSLDKALNAMRTRLGAGGGGFFGGGSSEGPRSLRQLLAFAGGVNRSTSMPTEQEMEAMSTAEPALQQQVTRLNAMVTQDIPAFFKALDAAGVPWTPGRPIR